MKSFFQSETFQMQYGSLDFRAGYNIWFMYIKTRAFAVKITFWIANSHVTFCAIATLTAIFCNSYSTCNSDICFHYFNYKRGFLPKECRHKIAKENDKHLFLLFCVKERKTIKHEVGVFLTDLKSWKGLKLLSKESPNRLLWDLDTMKIK